MARKIKNIEELKSLSTNGLECFILLNFGLRSSKHVWYDSEAKAFEVINYIDDSEQRLSEEEIIKKEFTNIGEAMEKGAFYYYD